MRTHFSKLTSLFALAALILISACSDDDDKTPANTLKVDGTSYTINQVYVSGWGSSNANYNLYITTNGITVDNDDDLVGTGKTLFVQIREVVGDADELAVGIYNEKIIGIYHGAITNDRHQEIEAAELDGDLSITKSGNNYTITFKAEGDFKYDVTYTGTVIYKQWGL